MNAFVGAAALLTFLLSPAALAQSGGHYALPWSTIAGGGGGGAGGRYSLQGTIGQPAVSTAYGGHYTLAGGFWTSQPEGPRLAITLVGSVGVISWPASATGFRLQETSDLVRRNWSFVPTAPLLVGYENLVVVPASRSFRFYRLIKP